MNEPWLLQVVWESNGCWCGNKTSTSTKKYVKLTLFPNEILTKQISNKNSTKQYLNTLPKESIKRISKEISTKNNFKRNPHNRFFTKTGKNRNWWHLLTFFQQIASVLILPCLFAMSVSNCLVAMFLHIFGRDFSSGIFFVEIFLHILFGRQMSLKRLFGKDVFFCLQNVSSELPWYYFLREILVEKFFEMFFWGEISLQIFWFIEMSSLENVLVGMLLPLFFGRGFFWNLFGRDFYSKFLW